MVVGLLMLLHGFCLVFQHLFLVVSRHRFIAKEFNSSSVISRSDMLSVHFDLSGNQFAPRLCSVYCFSISCSVESRPFAAICVCNRAAAYKAMGQILDAIVDCSLAIALDGNYYKAISRRAALYEMIRDYGQAVTDLQKLTSLLKKELDKKMHQSGASDKMDCMNELRQARFKLVEMEEADRNEISMNMYLFL